MSALNTHKMSKMCAYMNRKYANMSLAYTGGVKSPVPEIPCWVQLYSLQCLFTH